MKWAQFIGLTILLSSFQAERQSQNHDFLFTFEKLCVELRNFEKLAKVEAPFGGKHNVYLVKLWESNNLQPCMTTEFIFCRLTSASDLSEFHHFVNIDSMLVLLNFKSHFAEKYNFIDERIKPLIDQTIIEKNFPQERFLAMARRWFHVLTLKTYLESFIITTPMYRTEKIFFLSDLTALWQSIALLFAERERRIDLNVGDANLATRFRSISTESPLGNVHLTQGTY